jgi:hypothetical protein
MDTKHIKRRLLEPLKAHLKEKEISLIVGPRQAGKTTLMEELREDLIKSGEKTLFFNLDFDEDKQFFVSQKTLLQRIEIEFGKEKGFVFLDEIQRREDAGLFLKGLYDMHTPYKFIVSGSGSVELKEKVHESLMGRKLLFELYPVSFYEFADWKTEYRYGERLSEFFSLNKEEAIRLLDEYMIFGGYPRVLLADTMEMKHRMMNEIYQSYVEKDIAYLLHVEKLDAFRDLIKLLAGQTGQILNYSEITRTLGISIQTLKNYLWYAEKTFVVEQIRPYFKNIRKEITKAPTVYFFDSGLRNYAIGIFSQLNTRYDGFLFQNFIFGILKEEIAFQNAVIKYWRTKDQSEVDFIIETGENVLPIEVKYKDFKKEEIERSFRNFIEKYKPKIALVVNKSFEGKMMVSDTEIRFVPFWKLAGEVKTLIK